MASNSSLSRFLLGTENDILESSTPIGRVILDESKTVPIENNTVQ